MTGSQLATWVKHLEGIFSSSSQENTFCTRQDSPAAGTKSLLSGEAQHESVCVFKGIGSLTKFLPPGYLPGKKAKITPQKWSDEDMTAVANKQCIRYS